MDKEAIVRRKRGEQPLWVWLAVLTANDRRCTYCGERRSQTLEHETPLATKGRDVWWNLVPACDRCNGWKHKSSAAMWQFNMKMQHLHPKAGFARNTLPMPVVDGIKDRVEQVQREIQDPARLQWFEHHHGARKKPRVRRETLEQVESCTEALQSYPYPPWTSPEVRDSPSICTRRLCCGHTDPDTRLQWITVTEDEQRAFTQAAYHKGLSASDLLSHLVKTYLAERNDGRPPMTPSDHETMSQ
ncbi:HNH endonuclease [Streptomyces virginiae]|uniref:HNH endonuclease n=1 Tax=Streptomyces virginiae TaxID=1961 RepID=UPI0036B27C67